MFDSIKVKMVKMADCYINLAEGFEYAKKYESVGFSDPKKANEHSNRLGTIYKQMATMFHEWAASLKLNGTHFQSMMAPTNEKCLYDFQKLYEVSWFLSRC